MPDSWTGHAELLAADIREPGFTAAAIASAAWSARVDPEATRSLVRAAIVLTSGDATSACWARADPCPDDYTFVAAVAELETGLMQLLATTADMARACIDAMENAASEYQAARNAAIAAQVRMDAAASPQLRAAAEDGYDAAVRQMEAARAVAGDCEAALDILPAVHAALEAAMESVRSVPADMGEVYEVPYQFLRTGRTLPHDADFLTGVTT
jgi:hypothetical protein